MLKRKIRRSREWGKNNRMIDFDKARELRKQNREEFVRDHQPPEKPSKRKKIKLNRKRNFYSALVVVIIAVVGVSVFNVISVNSQFDDALAEKEELENEKAKLAHELENVDSEEYIEQQARTMLKMIKPGEIYYVVPKEEE